MKGNLLALILSIIFTVFLGEILCRSFSKNPYINENTFIQLIRIRQPNMDYTVDRRAIAPKDPHVSVKTDERAYYLPSRRFSKPDSTIVFLGGSTTECAAVREELRFPVVVSYELEKSGYKVNSLNIAMSGNTTHDSLNILLNHVVLDRPDIAILMEGINDIGVLAQDGGYQSRMMQPLRFQTLLDWTKQRLSSSSWLFARLRYFGAWHKKMGLTPRTENFEKRKQRNIFPEDDFRMRLKAFIALSRAFSIQPVLMTQPFSKFLNEFTPAWRDIRAQKRANEIVRELGEKEDVLVIDLMSYLSSLADYSEPLKIFFDGVHVTDYGSTLEGEYITKVLIESRILKEINSKKQ